MHLKFQNWNWNSNWKNYGSRIGNGAIIQKGLVPELELEQYLKGYGFRTASGNYVEQH